MLRLIGQVLIGTSYMRGTLILEIIFFLVFHHFIIINLSGPVLSFLGKFFYFLFKKKIIFISCDGESFLFDKNAVNIWMGGTSKKIDPKYLQFKNNYVTSSNLFTNRGKVLQIYPENFMQKNTQTTLHTRKHACALARAHTRTHTHMRAHTRTHALARAHTPRRVCARAHVHTHTHAQTHTRVRVRAHTR